MERDAMVPASDLENRGPEPKGAETVQADLRRVAGRRKPEPDVRDLAARLAAARALQPPDQVQRDTQHCGHCWGSGRDAAIRVIEPPDTTPPGVVET
jgi:hypothetical protein